MLKYANLAFVVIMLALCVVNMYLGRYTLGLIDFLLAVINYLGYREQVKKELQ